MAETSGASDEGVAKPRATCFSPTATDRPLDLPYLQPCGVADASFDMDNSEDAAVQFALYCLVHHQCEKPPHASCVGPRITALQSEYTKLFKQLPSKATVVKIMMGGAVIEIPHSRGMYVHSMAVCIPEHALAVLKHLEISLSVTDVFGVSNVPTWNM